MKEPKTHMFQPDIARHYGINAALVYSHILWRSFHSQIPWIPFTIDELAGNYPYLGRFQVWTALQLLCHGTPKLPSLVRRKNIDGTLYYAATREELAAAEKKYRLTGGYWALNIAVATKAGPCAGLIYETIRYWIERNWTGSAEVLSEKLNPFDFNCSINAQQGHAFDNTTHRATHFISVRRWHELHPIFSLRHVFESFDRLVKAGLLKKQRTRSRKPLWSVDKKAMARMKFKYLSANVLENENAQIKQEVHKSNAECTDQTANAQIKQESTLTDSASSTCDAHSSTDKSELDCALDTRAQPHSWSDSQVDPFSAREARGGSTCGRARARDLPPPGAGGGADKKPKTKSVDIPGKRLPFVPEKKPKLDHLGHPVTRKYQKKGPFTERDKYYSSLEQ